jgi:Ice-binding-like/PEP-CTERM motif
MRKSMMGILLLVAMVVGASTAKAQTVDLKSASTFGLLSDTISNTGTSIVVGNVGAKTTITGFPPGTAVGTVYPYPSDPTVAQAYTDFVSAFGAVHSPTQSFSDLTTSQLFLGNNVYTSTATDISTTTGITLTFDAQGDSSKVFIIDVTRDLTVNGAITFTLINGAEASNIFWIVGRTETIDPVGVPLTWDGNILAGGTFVMSALGPSSALAGTINGCVYSETSSTLAGKTQINGCSGTASTTPEPSSLLLFGTGLAALFGMVKRKVFL